jgi:hypothetical protein
MSEIRNEVKTGVKEEEIKKFVVRNATDVQRVKPEKLMKNPVNTNYILDAAKSEPIIPILIAGQTGGDSRTT